MVAAAPAPVADVLPPPFPYTGVERSPCGRWTAHVLNPDQRTVRVIGVFPDEHAAALARDRVAIAFHGAGADADLNFRTAFYPIERQFLLRYRVLRGDTDVCGIVADGSYEGRYASFLRTVLALEQYGEFMDVIMNFYIDRASEIGKEALLAGGEKLAAKFVAMYRNKAVNPEWRAWYHRKLAAGRDGKAAPADHGAGGQQQQQQ